MNLITPRTSYNTLFRILPAPLQHVVTKTIERAGDGEAENAVGTDLSRPRHNTSVVWAEF